MNPTNQYKRVWIKLKRSVRRRDLRLFSPKYGMMGGDSGYLNKKSKSKHRVIVLYDAAERERMKHLKFRMSLYV